MALLKLPNELLGTILDLSRPYTFEDLALTCKHIYSIARPFLVRHNELRRKYRHLSFPQPGYYPTGIDKPTWFVPQLLLDIARDPLVASYIVHANLGQRNYTEDYSREPDESVHIVLEQLRDEKNKDKLRNFLQASWFLQAVDADADDWLKHISGDSEYDERCDFGLVFLMTLLVNVESLTLPGSWSSANAEPRENREEGVESYQYGVSQLMQLLVQLANDGTSRDSPLKKLRKLNPSQDPDSQFGIEMISIAPFLSLESMRQVHHTSGRYECFGSEPLWETMYPAIGPNIESLELYDYVIDDKASKTFFKDMKKLKIFKMEYNMKDEIGTDWKPGDFVHNLMSGVGSHLEVLSLKISWLFSNEEPVTDLSGFTALQQLDLDVELFQRYENLENDDDNDNDDDGDDGDDCDNEEERSILQMLPESLPTLRKLRLECLSMSMDVRRLAILLRDFESNKSLQLPNLVKTEVYFDADANSTMRDVNDEDAQVQRVREICRDITDLTVTTSEKHSG